MRTAESPQRLFARRLAWCSVLLLLISQLTSAERLPLKSYNTADGLPHNAINKIVRDSRGFLWFCTDEGLSRFDGYTFTNYGVEQGLPHRTVNDFLETRSGEIWVATNAGLVRFDPKGAPANRVVYLNEATAGAPSMFTVVVPQVEDRAARVATVLLEGRDGTIWCGSMKYLYRLERRGGRFELLPVDLGILGKYPQQIYVLDVLEDRQGSLWIASFVGLLRRRPDGSSERYTTRDGLPDDNVHDLLEDHQGRLWAGTRLGGFFRFTGDDTRAAVVVEESYGERDGLQTDWVFQLFETSDRRFWVATNKGLVEFFPDNGGQSSRFRTYARRNGLSFQEITALTEDTAGNLWLGTNAAGTMKLAHNGFVTYNELDGLVGVYAIFEDATGAVCFRGGVLGDEQATVFEGARLELLRTNADSYHIRFGRFDGHRFDWFKPDIPFDFGWVVEQLAVQTRDGEWWVGSGRGLYRLPRAENFAHLKTARPLAVYTMKDGLASQQVFRLFADSGGNVWVSAFGLARWDRATQTLHNLADAPGLPSLKEELPRSFGEDRDGNIWVGMTTGVARYHDGAFTFFTSANGLPPGGIMNIHTDHAGRLWLASSRGGLIRVDDPVAERPTFTSYTTAQGLSSNSTEVITEDLDGRIYVATGRGLDQLDPGTGRIKHFTTDDGLAPGNVIAAFRDRHGVLWFGTQRGLSRFVPAPAETAPPPPILITGLNVAGERRTISALGESEIALADLEPGRNQLQIDFVALGFASGDVLHYQYKLEGSGAEWSPAAAQRSINYASLAPGSYRFLVRAMNSDGVVSDRPAAIGFTVLRPVWQRWWFLSLVAFALIALVYAAYRYRLSRLVELERVRARIATDLHDDIGAGLSRIAVLSEVARHEAGGSPVNERLSVIASASRELVDSMSDIVWVINPERDQLRDLTQRMRRFASDVFAAGDTQLTFRGPGPEQHLKVGADVRRQLFLIFKEAINNIARHSGCAAVEVELEVEDRGFTLTVRDDGCGFDPGAASDGNGLSSMRARARMMGGDLRLESEIGRGTVLTLRAPLKATVKEHNGRLHGTQV